jgi:hypothetical protein
MRCNRQGGHVGEGSGLVLVACDLISEEDRQWFEDHPNRLFRLRFATDGDLGGTKHGYLVLAFCYTDGLRWRAPFPTTMSFARSCEMMEHSTDADLSVVFRQLMAGFKLLTVGYANGSTRSGRLMAEYLGQLYEACRKRGRRLRDEVSVPARGVRRKLGVVGGSGPP